MMTPKQFVDLSTTLEQLAETEPDLRFSFDGTLMSVGFWFTGAKGRQYICACAPTFSDAFAKACNKRVEALKEAEVEAQVRAEVARRMAEAA